MKTTNRLSRLINCLVLLTLLFSAALPAGVMAASEPVAQVRLAAGEGVTACTDITLVATADTYLRQSYPTRNYGATTTVQTSPNTSYRQNILMVWDLSGIPAGVTVSAASLTFYVTEGSTYDFSLFNMRRTWVEGI